MVRPLLYSILFASPSIPKPTNLSLDILNSKTEEMEWTQGKGQEKMKDKSTSHLLQRVLEKKLETQGGYSNPIVL